ncbi:MAG: hypothetical protein O7C59_04585 [Rickettsia endosymbiont of Ixodes persulcatus]|nr:hypothetical protein [Rickettsia endosymbiont of Ixodes persulcatus]MCZ6913815.1 hypothetical protein [Rickettsia endosymbiont of Ixodes persulcatus]
MGLCEALARNSDLSGEVFNFSNGTQYTGLKLIKTILDLMHSALRPIILGKNKGETLVQYLDSSKAHKDLGWRPCFTLEKGLERTITWYKNCLGNEQNELSLMYTE